jgi:hypothetical protein
MRAGFALLVGAFIVASASSAWSGTAPSGSAEPTGTPTAVTTPVPSPSPSWSPVPVTPTPNSVHLVLFRAQALAGAKVFAAHCAQCHGTQLEGGAGPALVGPDFTDSVASDHLSLGDFFGMVAYQMPYDAPGSLSHADYENVVAFLLSRNGQTFGPAGIVYDTAMQSKVPFLAPAP